MFAIHFLSAPVYKAKYSKRNRTRKIRRPKSDRTKKKKQNESKHWQSICSLEGAESFKVSKNGCQVCVASA